MLSPLDSKLEGEALKILPADAGRRPCLLRRRVFRRSRASECRPIRRRHIGRPRRQLPTASYRAPRRQLPTASYRAPRRQLPTASYRAPRRQLPTASYRAPRRQLPTASYRAPRRQLPTASYRARRQLRTASRTRRRTRWLPAPTRQGPPGTSAIAGRCGTFPNAKTSVSRLQIESAGKPSSRARRREPPHLPLAKLVGMLLRPTLPRYERSGHSYPLRASELLPDVATYPHRLVILGMLWP